MSRDVTSSISVHFEGLEDPRRYNRRHKLLDIVVIAICAVICGADDWPGVESYGESKQPWLSGFLELPHGIPTQYTFRRVFAALDAEQFEACFLNWITAAYEITAGQVVALDGKQVRRSYDRQPGQSALHLVSAWATANHLMLGEVKVDSKSNEITALPELLQVLALHGCIVTIDALGCQKEITQQIVAQEADYVLALKANQSGLYADVVELFRYAGELEFADCDYDKTVEKGHGRIETRECWTLQSPEYLAYLRDRSQWRALRTLVMVRRQRCLGDVVEQEVKYYISSVTESAQRLLEIVRGHWGIENQLHWVLDIAFREDDSRLRKGNGAQNFAILRRIALNLLKQESTAKCGIKNKRLKAGWDHKYLLKVLAG